MAEIIAIVRTGPRSAEAITAAGGRLLLELNDAGVAHFDSIGRDVEMIAGKPEGATVQ